MTTLLEFKEKIREVYATYTVYVDIVLKTALTLLCLFWIRGCFPEGGIFSNVFVIIVVSLLCSILPLRVIPITCGVFIIGQAFRMGIDAGVVTAVILVVLLRLFLRFVPDDSLAFIFMPIAMYFGLPALIPISYGLRKTPASFLSIVSGCVVYYTLESLVTGAEALSKLEQTEYVERLTVLLGGIVSDSSIVINILALAGVVIIVYAVRRLGFDFAFEAAIIVGAAVYVFFILLGNVVVQTTFDTVSTVIGAVAAVLVALILNFFFLSLDYRRTEKVEFEDDEYYYYVKAIPKAYAYKRKLPVYHNDQTQGAVPAETDIPQVSLPGVEDIDFEKKLEDSLRDL